MWLGLGEDLASGKKGATAHSLGRRWREKKRRIRGREGEEEKERKRRRGREGEVGVAVYIYRSARGFGWVVWGLGTKGLCSAPKLTRTERLGYGFCHQAG